jgi:hypothetical protein
MEILLTQTDLKQMYKLVFRNSLALLYYIGDSLKPRRPSSIMGSFPRRAASPAVIILIMYKLPLACNSFSFFLSLPARVRKQSSGLGGQTW